MSLGIWVDLIFSGRGHRVRRRGGRFEVRDISVDTSEQADAQHAPLQRNVMATENPLVRDDSEISAVRRAPRRFGAWILGILLGAMLAVILFGAVVWLSTGLGLMHLIGALRGGRTAINVDQPTVVHQIQQLQRLETVSYTMDKIIAGEHENPYLPKFLAGDRLLLVVHGEVIGGIDLSQLQPGDVQVQRQKVSVHLPAAEVFSTRIDNAKTRVYSRDTGLFSAPDPNLETEVRQEAERQLQQAALQDGILKTASENARSTISGMLRGFGFQEVDVQ
jgi:Protein of unknown function (DUF4230)